MQSYIRFEKHEKLYRLATKKLSDVEFEREEISTKFDKANQIIGVLRFENNFLAEKTKKLEVKLFQVSAQLEKTSSAKLDEMLSLQKSAFNRIGLGYDFSSPSIASTSTTVFVAPSKIRRKLRTLWLKRLTLKSLNRGSSISVIIVELPVILDQITING